MLSENEPKHEALLTTLQRLLELPTTSVSETLYQSAQLVAQALHAEKVDTFLYDPATESLVAYGTSKTPMGTKEQAHGLDRLPLSEGGRAVEVYLTGRPYWSGQVQRDPAELTGMKETLGVRSEILVPLSVDGTLRGVVLASSSASYRFTQDDLHFLEAVTHWIGVVIHRAELIEQQTREAVAQAHRLAAEEILTVMAHDLGNYLTPLKIRLELLERQARREGLVAYERELLTMSQTLVRLKRLSADLLDVARLRQGIFALHLHSFDLVEVIWDVVPIWRSSQHPIEVHAPEQMIVIADQSRIQQVLENLLSNATTHADPRTAIHVTVQEEYYSDHPWVQVTVSNRAPAIPEEQLATLFMPFAKGDHSRGMGLGLYLAERIAHAHHGRLTVRTGAGSTMHFTLSWPRQPDNEKAETDIPHSMS
jgi:two-component system OmpR family sensor kinase